MMQQQQAPAAATIRPARWRGPRRPDVQELRYAQTARVHTQQQQQPQTQQPPQFYDSQPQHTQQPHMQPQHMQQPQRTMDDADILAAAFGTSQQYQQPPSQFRPRQVEAAAGVRHFKFGFLSAGHADPAAQAATAGTLRINRRPGIMDATRMFEDEEASVAALSAEAKTARAVAAATRERHAAGLGYGTAHRDHFAYLSKALPPRAAEPIYGERPCAFPTVALSDTHSKADPLGRPPGDLLALPFEQQMEYSAAFKRRVASGLGYGAKRPNHFAYLANTYWRK